MRTEFINQLEAAPVEPLRIREPVRKRVNIGAQSDASQVSETQIYEKYRIKVEFSAEFSTDNRTPKEARDSAYRGALHVIAKGVYGEVEAQIHYLMRAAYEIDDYEARNEVLSRCSTILEMMSAP